MRCYIVLTEVCYSVEQRHVGSSYGRVADLRVEGHLTHKHRVQRHLWNNAKYGLTTLCRIDNLGNISDQKNIQQNLSFTVMSSGGSLH